MNTRTSKDDRPVGARQDVLRSSDQVDAVAWFNPCTLEHHDNFDHFTVKIFMVINFTPDRLVSNSSNSRQVLPNTVLVLRLAVALVPRTAARPNDTYCETATACPYGSLGCSWRLQCILLDTPACIEAAIRGKGWTAGDEGGGLGLLDWDNHVGTSGHSDPLRPRSVNPTLCFCHRSLDGYEPSAPYSMRACGTMLSLTTRTLFILISLLEVGQSPTYTT